MLGRSIGVGVIVSIVILAMVFQLTTPSTAGPLGVLLVFLFSYLLVLGVLTFSIFSLSKLRIRIYDFFNSKKTRRSLTLVRAYYFSSVLALAPVILVGMQSVGEVSAYDILLVLLFVGVACFYVAKRTV